MSYEPDKIREIEPMLPPTTLMDAVIIDIEDGVVKDFISAQALEKLDKDSHEQKVINVWFEVSVPDRPEKVRVNQLFSYYDKGYTRRSKMGRFARRYGSVPKVGMVVKVMTNVDGYASVVLD